jgi:hypothetical protein
MAAIEAILAGCEALRPAQEALYQDLHATASSATKKPALPGRLEGLTTNRSPKFLPPMQPTLRTGTGALLAAALAWLAP